MNHRFRARCGRSILYSLSIVITVALSSSAFGQSKNPFFADEAKSIQQVSLSSESEFDPSNPNPLIGEQESGEQLRVTIRYLLVDDAARRQIYAKLPSDAIDHRTHAPAKIEKKELNSSADTSSCVKRINGHGFSATCLVNREVAKQIVEIVETSTTCNVSEAPSVILQQNRTAEINDMVQRPLVVDLKREQGELKPVIRVVDEGTRMRLFARLVRSTNGNDSIQLTTEFVDTRILEVKRLKVLGIEDSPTTLQHPLCAATTVEVTNTFGPQQLLLIDPHLTRQTTVEIEIQSILGNLPLVGRAFTDTETRELDNHLLVLIQPSIYSAGSESTGVTSTATGRTSTAR